MHCPKCGNQQSSDDTSFCTKCGFEITDVKELLSPELSDDKKNNTDKLWRGLGQGLGLIVVGFVLTLILELLQDINLVPKIIVKITFISFLIAGIVRISFSLIFGKDLFSAQKKPSLENDESINNLTGNATKDRSLPEGQYQPPINCSNRKYDTAKIVSSPPSVTENTTKHLEKQLEQE